MAETFGAYRLALIGTVSLAVVLAVGTFVSDGSAVAQNVNVDYDPDNDGLIEVSSLAQLNAIRWDLDGDGSVDESSDSTNYSSAFPNAVSGMGCPSTGCEGYELTADLDFDTNNDGKTNVAGDAYWNYGDGWDPIGGKFSGKLDGNGKTISNLFIDATAADKDDSYGLFAFVTEVRINDEIT